MGHENETISRVSFDLFETLVTVNEVRITERSLEGNDHLLEAVHDV